MRDRTLEDWLDALRVKTAKAKRGMPCPLCAAEGPLPRPARNAGAGRDWRVSAYARSRCTQTSPASSSETPSTTLGGP